MGAAIRIFGVAVWGVLRRVFPAQLSGEVAQGAAVLLPAEGLAPPLAVLSIVVLPLVSL